MLDTLVLYLLDRKCVRDRASRYSYGTLKLCFTTLCMQHRKGVSLILFWRRQVRDRSSLRSYCSFCCLANGSNLRLDTKKKLPALSIPWLIAAVSRGFDSRRRHDFVFLILFFFSQRVQSPQIMITCSYFLFSPLFILQYKTRYDSFTSAVKIAEGGYYCMSFAWPAELCYIQLFWGELAVYTQSPLSIHPHQAHDQYYRYNNNRTFPWELSWLIFPDRQNHSSFVRTTYMYLVRGMSMMYYDINIIADSRRARGRFWIQRVIRIQGVNRTINNRRSN